MAFFDWTPAMQTGITAIDAQHRGLVDYVNRLHEAMRAGKGREEIGPVLEGLAAYAVEHFGTEERAFLTCGYPDREAHVAEHEAFKAKVSAFMQAYARGELTLGLDTLVFLMDWVKNHISASDMRYVPFLKGKDLT
jgi:hemerythrin